jgi:hypothetical protein
MKRGKAIVLPDAESDEAAAPQASDIERGKEIVGTASPLLGAILEASPED